MCYKFESTCIYLILCLQSLINVTVPLAAAARFYLCIHLRQVVAGVNHVLRAAGGRP